ncbi:hypothetical protein BDV12DRAFT_200996 [Aspergillus spectabilis]
MKRISLPNGTISVEVGVIDSTTRMTLPASHLLAPTPGLNEINLTAPSHSFFIQHPSGRILLFDLGLRKDWWNLTPTTAQFLDTAGWKVEVGKNVSEILQESGISLADIEAVIWSHHHFDHVGDMTTFPFSTKVIVGPGFKEHYLPSFPTDPKSTLLEEQWKGRELYELSFGDQLHIGEFNAVDYFGDGSFYILDSPGHTYGHIAALARVTADGNDAPANSFVFMGGDTCHFAGQLRPTTESPLPPDIAQDIQLHVATCPGAIMERLLADRSRPLFEMPEANAVDVEIAHQSIHKLQAFDRLDNVWVIIAHDESLLDQIDFHPTSINDWRQKGCGEKTRWKFLNALRNQPSNL